MKSILFISGLTLALAGCNGRNAKTPDTSSTDTVKAISTHEKPVTIYIKDRSQYDDSFIAQLPDDFGAVQLIDNYIVTGSDTTFFPDALPLNTETTLKGTRDGRHYELKATRINQTSLNYTFTLRGKDGRMLHTKHGKATLNPSFFLAPEGDKDEKTAGGYGSTEYNQQINDCYVSIRIALEKDTNGKLRAKIIYGCQDHSQPKLNLEECPVLRSK